MFVSSKDSEAATPIEVIGQVATDDFYAGKVGGFNMSNLKGEMAAAFVR